MKIQQIIDDRLLKEYEAEKKTHVRSGKFSPSSLGSCFRKQILNRADYPITDFPDARTLRVWKVGKLLHEYVQSILPEEYQKEVLLETDDVKGYADIVSKEESCVDDIKTVHSRKFFYILPKKANSKKNTPAETTDEWNTRFEQQEKSRILQVMWYAMQLNLKYGQVSYMDKDSLNIFEPLLLTENWVDEVNDELICLRMYWSLHLLPVAKARAFESECDYCSWKEACAKLGTEERKCELWN